MGEWPIHSGIQMITTQKKYKDQALKALKVDSEVLLFKWRWLVQTGILAFQDLWAIYGILLWKITDLVQIQEAINTSKIITRVFNN